MNSARFSTTFRRPGATLAILALVIATPAFATPIPVVNGGFESVTGAGVSAEIGTRGTENVTGWTTSGYNFVFTPGTADTTGAIQGNSTLKLWGPNNGGTSDNALPDSSPLGGNYLALDGAYEVGAISQSISGLTVGAQYQVEFYYAGAQQSGFNGDTTEAVKVSLGHQTIETPILHDPSHDFTGWQLEDLTFTATSATETLSFLAVGTPTGVPPMTLLDGISVNDLGTPTVPEPSSLALMMTGFAGVGGMLRSRFKKS